MLRAQLARRHPLARRAMRFFRTAQSLRCAIVFAVWFGALAKLTLGQGTVDFELPAIVDEQFVDSPDDHVSTDEKIRLAERCPYECDPCPPTHHGFWLDYVRFGYDDGFVLVSNRQVNLHADNSPFVLRINGWGQMRHTISSFEDPDQDINKFQLKRARLIFSGHAYSPDFMYFVQLDGRSSSGDDMRLLDYFLTFDFAHHWWGIDRGILGFKAGKYKMPFNLARYLSGRELEFTDRSVASTYFDVNRSLGWGLYGGWDNAPVPWDWEVAVFNGLVTGGAETGSSGALDDNFAYSGRVFVYPIGDWGEFELADFEWHESLAVRAGTGFASSRINRRGRTEFDSIRVVASGQLLSSILPADVEQYVVNLWAVDTSFKYRGWSFTTEYYFRQIDSFLGDSVPQLFDHGLWLQVGKFICPERFEILARWSRVMGNSGTLGVTDESTEEIAGGVVWYGRGQNAKWTFDATYLNGAPIDSASLDISPGNTGWLFRSQIQFGF